MAWRPVQMTLVAHHPRVRWRLTREVADVEIGFGLDRTERLAEEGIFDAEVDTREFARELVRALSEQLSIRDLECLVEEFSRELLDQETTRQALLETFAQDNPDNPDNPDNRVKREA